MTVHVRNLQGGRRASTTFSDPMSTPLGTLGANWASGSYNPDPLITPMRAICSFQKENSTLDANPCMTVRTIDSGVGGVCCSYLIPIFPVGLLNKAQFAQWTVVQHFCNGVGNMVTCGPSVFNNMPGASGFTSAYTLHLETAAGTGSSGSNRIFVVRRDIQVTVVLAGPTLWANGDVLRIDAVPSADLTSVTVVYRRNGSIISSTVDNSVNRILTGMPGFVTNSMNNTDANYDSEWRNFSCGPGSTT